MPRSAMIILTFGLMFPAQGQSDRSPSRQGTDFVRRRGSLKFVPRAPGARRRSPGAPVPQTGHRGQFGPLGYGSPQQPGSVQPAMWPRSGAMQQPATGRRGSQLGAQAGRRQPRKFLLDARNVRAKEGRVPNGFGQLGLSQIQRERIYGIRALYEKHVEHLEALIERLESEELIQCQRILTKNQRFIYQRQQAAKN